MKLSKELLSGQEEFNYNSMLNGTDVRGSYNTMQFAIRLRDDIRTALNRNDLENDRIQAFSTSLHENIHWWQHIGSNFGFLFSLTYPAFAHLIKRNLDNLISDGIKYKSLIKFDELNNHKINNVDLNTILNTFYDIAYAKQFALDNKSISKIIKDNRFYLHIGHCYSIFYASTFSTISSTIDPEHTILPNSNEWAIKFRKLTENRVPGFFINSPVGISPLGVRAIYEGQAVFCQMQYLTVALDYDLTYSDFENVGLLHGIYLEAFHVYLQITKLEKPYDLIDPVVGLFLLVCDLAINPNNGFPEEIYDYEGFINKNDPGIRFVLICNSIALKPKYFCDKLKSYSKEEYITLNIELSESIGCKPSYETINTVLKWSQLDKMNQILNEEQDLKFSKENLSIRLMISKYYRFQEDKFKYPNVFCWFGLYARYGGKEFDSGIAESLFQKHHALFIDDYDGEIKPVIFKGRREEDINESFNSFYYFTILYDLIYKWVSEEGKFNLKYKWLVNEREGKLVPIVQEEFKKLFGVDLNEIKIL